MNPVVQILARVCVDTRPIMMDGKAANYRQTARIVNFDFLLSFLVLFSLRSFLPLILLSSSHST